MQIALLADIHGNDIALEAVLTDIEQQGGVDTYWILGDLVAIGHAPVKVLERLTALPHVRFIRGNSDRYVCTGERPSPSVQEVKTNLDLLPTLLEVEGSFSWTQGAITAAGWFEWLADLPLEFRAELPDGTQVLSVHAAPGRDAGKGFRPEMNEAEAEEMVAECEADLICVGHTHSVVNIQVGDKRVVNPGSVGHPPLGADVRASYAVIMADEQRYAVAHRHVAYDRAEVMAILQAIKHPSAAFLSRYFQGSNQS
jgi:predicted phosphodiesterase